MRKRRRSKQNPVTQKTDVWKKEGYKSKSSFKKKIMGRGKIYSAYRFVKKSIGKEWAKFATQRGEEIFKEYNKQSGSVSTTEAVVAIRDIAEKYIAQEVDKIARDKNLNLSAQFKQAIVDATCEEADRAMSKYVYKF